MHYKWLLSISWRQPNEFLLAQRMHRSYMAIRCMPKTLHSGPDQYVPRTTRLRLFEIIPEWLLIASSWSEVQQQSPGPRLHRDNVLLRTSRRQLHLSHKRLFLLQRPFARLRCRRSCILSSRIILDHHTPSNGDTEQRFVIAVHRLSCHFYRRALAYSAESRQLNTAEHWSNSWSRSRGSNRNTAYCVARRIVAPAT